MEIEFEFKKIGGSIMITLPTTFVKHIEVNEGDIGIIKDDQGKYGKFISLWKKE